MPQVSLLPMYLPFPSSIIKNDQCESFALIINNHASSKPNTIIALADGVSLPRHADWSKGFSWLHDEKMTFSRQKRPAPVLKGLAPPLRDRGW